MVTAAWALLHIEADVSVETMVFKSRVEMSRASASLITAFLVLSAPFSSVAEVCGSGSEQWRLGDDLAPNFHP